MIKVRRSKITRRKDSGEFDILIIILIALFLVAGLIYVLFQIIGHSEEHVDTVRNTKVIYKESLRWRPDSELCESRIRQDLIKSPNRKKVDYADLNLSEKCLKLIGQMSRVEKLNLSRSTVQDQWLEHLIELPLRWLSLEGNPITDKAIPFILKMKNLKYLCIGDTELTDKGLEMLAAHRSLKTLVLNSSRCVTDDGIKHVGKMKQLTGIELINPAALTGQCLASFTNLKDLLSLKLENICVAPEDLRYLSGLKNLRDLDLSNCQLTDLSLVEISSIDSLKKLNLTGSAITGKGLMLLTKLSRLSALTVMDCPDLDEKALAKFRLAMPQCFVEHSVASALSEKMSGADLKKGVEFLEEEVSRELKDTKSETK
jgi:Leucine-rich repeat (LRR) protein